MYAFLSFDCKIEFKSMGKAIATRYYKLVLPQQTVDM